MLFSRSIEESQLYIKLHPCDCGEDDFMWTDHQLARRGDAKASIYHGTCESCGRERRFEFTMSSEHPPPPAFGSGDQPSQIIDPGEFLLASRRAAGLVRVDPNDLPPQARYEVLYELEMAVAALKEVLKFFPPGSDSLPLDAFTSEHSKSVLSADPTQFSRSQIVAELELYRHMVRRYKNALNGE